MKKSPDSIDPYKGARVAVLGASGFVGRWVARALCARGATVYLIVRDKSAAEQVFAKYKVEGEIYEADLQYEATTRKLFREIKPAITFNLAGYGVDRSERDKRTAYEINAKLVEVICESVSTTRDPAWSGQEVLHVGSALEYGTTGSDLSEDSTPSPTTLYGKSKLAGTIALARSCKTHEISGLTARLFTVYGPGEHYGRLLPSLLETARNGNALNLTAGTQMRDFTFVEDVAEGLLRLGLVKAKPGEIVNLATGCLTSVGSFVKTAASILQIPKEILKFGVITIRTEEMRHDPVSLNRLRQLIGWIPSTGIEEGIFKTMSFENAHNL